MRIALISLVVPAALFALPAQAQEYVASDAIMSGDYAKAEKDLRQELRVFPDRPELMLNLAAVYARTGRDADARALYNEVLARQDVLMDVSTGTTAGSHAVARKGLNRLETVQFTAR